MSLHKVLPPHMVEALKNDKAKRLLDKQGRSNPRFEAFKEKYWNNRAGFMQDCIKWPAGVSPYPYQIETMALLDSGIERMAMRGGHGLTKTAMSAILVLHFALTRSGKDWKIVTTASVWRQLVKYLWPEIHKWARMLDWNKIGRKPFNSRTELLSQNLRVLESDGKTTGEAFAAASNDHTALEGAHADHMLYLFDESKAIDAAIWDAAEGAMTSPKHKAMAWAVSTPGDTSGRFYDIFTKRNEYADWTTRFITLEERIAAGSVSLEWIEARKRQWGEDSAIYRNRVLGEFAPQDSDGIIPVAWVDEAMGRWEDIYGNTQHFNLGLSEVVGQASLSKDTEEIVTDIGVDVGLGGEGGDKSVEVVAVFPHVLQIHRTGRGSSDTITMQLSGRVRQKLEKFRNAIAYLDTIGIGAGVYHRLKEQDAVKSRVMPFNAANRTPIKDQNKQMGFVNKRAAMWWLMRELLDPENDTGIALPKDDQLLSELVAPKYTDKSDGKIQVEAKGDIRKRIGRSTDTADGVIMALTGGKIAKIADTQVYQVGVGYVDT